MSRHLRLQAELSRTLEEGLQAYRAGRLADAERRYRSVLDRSAEHPDALYLLGLLCLNSGRTREARSLLAKAAGLRPADPGIQFALGNALKAQGEPAAAESCYRRALDLAASFPEPHVQLGNLAQGRGDLEGAIGHYEAALQARPGFPEALSNLASMHSRLGRIEQAISLWREAIAAKADYADAHCNLAVALRQRGQDDEARRLLERALELRPAYPEALNNLGNLLASRHEYGAAIELYRRALQLEPAYADAHYNLGNSLVERCELDEAIAHFRRSLELQPGREDAVNNLLFALNYHPTLAPEAIFEEYRRRARVGLPQPAPAVHHNDRDESRRLKVGYVSADLRQHAVSHFLEPLLACHDRGTFEVFAYSNGRRPDEVTARLRATVDHWRDIAELSDAQVADLVRRDGIDILVDLSGRTRGNRLAVFARSPAPVQVSYLGFGYTTGIEQIGYFLTDARMCPEGAERLLVEQPWRLPRGAFCYRAPEDAPGPVAPPALANGFVTFGSLSRTARVNERVVASWSRILQAVPGSRLRLDQRAFTDPSTRELYLARFAAHGIAGERIVLSFTSPHWSAYQEIDIALDPFPHNGGTTTVEALWMGVPVVSMVDRPPLGRFGATFLPALGMEDWLARDEAEYVAIAARAAGDLEGLRALRAGLRQRMRASELCDEAGFARAVEQAYRGMWHRWCAEGGSAKQDLAALLREAVARHSSGELPQAEALYRRILELEPEQGDALNLLGVIAYQRGIFPEAEALARRAVATDPRYAPYLVNLGNALFAQNKLEEAAAALREAASNDPASAESRMNLGNVLNALGRPAEAEEAFREAVRAEPNAFEPRIALAGVLLARDRRAEAGEVVAHALGFAGLNAARLRLLASYLQRCSRLADAAEAWRRVVRADPTSFEAWQELSHLLNELQDYRGLLAITSERLAQKPDDPFALQSHGTALFRLKRYKEALEAADRALALREAFPEAHNLRAAILSTLRRADEALAAVDRALELRPEYSAALVTRAEVLRQMSRFVDASQSLRRAVEVNPENALGWSNLGAIESDLGNFAAARAAYRRSLELDQGFVPALSNSLFCINYDPDVSSEALYRAYTEVPRRLATAGTIPYHANTPSPNRRLRIGYVSGDLAHHVVRHFMEHLLERHDAAGFELFLYDNTEARDEYGKRLKDMAEHWRDARSMSDDELARAIVQDAIDILVDLSGHTKGNRLAVFARKPAPIQMTYLGFGYTTGLPQIDYFLADPWFVPDGAQRWFAEEVFRLPRCMFCYRPAEDVPEVAPLPALAGGHVTFGSLSRPIRFNDRVVDAWSSILAAVPGSRLLLDNRPFSDPGICEMVKARFAARGVDTARITTRYSTSHWLSYHDIDIALDPFPHNAGTTTVESLWMGVPVLSKEDRPSLGRFGATLLHAVKMPEWLARTEEEYVDKARAFASDIPALARLRAGLRARVRESTLRDEKGFVRAVEEAYRRMWRKWCAQRRQP